MTAMRTQISIGLALLMVLGVVVQLRANPIAERFTFARPPAPESTVDPKSGRMGLDLNRWSTAAERDLVAATIRENGPEPLLDAFRDTGRIGTLYWPGGLDYAVRYAWRSPRADGDTDVVLVVDRPLWLWWDASPPSTPYRYTVVQMRLGTDGVGEGRVSMGTSVATDPALGVVLSDFAKAPALLADVRREHDGTR
jgi:hypothetical protein